MVMGRPQCTAGQPGRADAPTARHATVHDGTVDDGTVSSAMADDPMPPALPPHLAGDTGHSDRRAWQERCRRDQINSISTEHGMAESTLLCTCTHPPGGIGVG